MAAEEKGLIGIGFTRSIAELQTVMQVIDRFRDTSSQGMIFESHIERAWRENVDRPKRMISYVKYGFDIGSPVPR